MRNESCIAWVLALMFVLLCSSFNGLLSILHSATISHLDGTEVFLFLTLHGITQGHVSSVPFHKSINYEFINTQCPGGSVNPLNFLMLLDNGDTPKSEADNGRGPICQL